MEKKSIFHLLIILVIVVGIFLILPKDKKLVSPSPKNNPGNLKQAIENKLVDSKGTYGIVVKNFKTGESYFLNEDRIFEPGSLYKIWIMAVVFDQIEKGEITGDKVLSQDVSALNEAFNIPSDSAELTDGVVTLTVQAALEQMIVISHNYAALLLSERVKLSQVSLFLKEHGLNQSGLGEPPETTPKDIALFFEKLYEGGLAGKENTDKMIAVLKRQQLNNGLPKYLPQNIEIAHKTGDIGWFKHDAGIVFAPNADYIIIVLSESDFPEGAQERIAGISKAVFEYFTKI